MLRKICLTTILLLGISTVCFGNGFYVGAGLGPQTANLSQKAHFVQPTHSNVIDKTQFSGTGIFGTLFAGYEFMFRKNFYLSGEVNGNGSSLRYNSVNDEYIHKTFTNTYYQMDQTYGVSVLPGWLVTDRTLFYGRLGYANSHFKVYTQDSSLANINTWLGGVRFGAGVSHAFSKKWAARMEYSQVYYESTKMHVLTPFFLKNTIITPQTGQVEFSLIYNFGC